MKGCQPLSPSQYRALLDAAGPAPWGHRDRALWTLCAHTGLRISEALSLDVAQVFDGPKPRPRVTLPRRAAKGRENGRIILIPGPAAHALEEWISTRPHWLPPDAEAPVFVSRHGERLSRRQALDRFKAAMEAAHIPPPHGSHTLRKTFAAHVWRLTDHDLRTTQEALGHASPASTACYLEPAQDLYTTILRNLDLETES